MLDKTNWDTKETMSLDVGSSTPLGPSHWKKTGVSVTPGGREMEQVRETVSPPRMEEEEGEEARVTFAASERRKN